MLSPRDRWHALRRRNFLQSILLHSVNTSVEIAEVVLNCEKELPLPPDDEIEPQEMEEKELPLLESRNLKGETPIYRAAIDGNLQLLKYLTKQVADLEKHFHRNIDKVSILHADVVAQRFEVPLWLLKLDETQLDGTLAYEKDDNGCTCLQLLSTMPSVFRSGTHYGIVKQRTYDFIYDYFLPKFRYKDDEDVVSSNFLIPTGDIENGENNIKLQIPVLSRINSAIWSRLSKEWHGIYRILKRVENMLPRNLVIHRNNDNLTAQELFLKEHESMLIEARNWIKDTAQSCSTVAVLIATVVYAAAYSTPGGTDERGLPKFLGSSNFLFFTIADVVALGSSLASVVMFLSILTSSFQIKDFYKSLLRKLSLGFAFLSLSLISTMLAFSATVVITMKLEKSNWALILIYTAAALFPIVVFISFGKLFYEVIKELRRQTLGKIWNMLPRCFRRWRPRLKDE
ncbi:hypothetical protein L6164_002890 [Bauhinia variegata]|uniref:Uncharacterized protein n=1 Tax=Bauhinia variegata TaxID=167791 RepID=A0ACB9PZH1_BAUVA|nr:hypothetical protein L6164_002890 [Bauhinia variegata]